MKDFHIDMSGKLDRKNQSVGIACCNYNRDVHCGIYLGKGLKELVKKKLYSGEDFVDCAKFYAILCYLISRKFKPIMKSLVICNDEDIKLVIKYLGYLDSEISFLSESISNYRKNNCLEDIWKSRADSLSKKYEKRGGNLVKSQQGRKLNLVEINFELIKTLWEKIKKCEGKITPTNDIQKDWAN